MWPISAFAMDDWWLVNPADSLPDSTVYEILSNFLFWILAIFAIIGVISFVVAGMIYLLSAGETEMIERAKKAMRWAIVGVVVGLSGIIIIQAVDAMLNAQAEF